MLAKIQESLSDPKQVIIGIAGLSLFGFYALYARKQIFEEKAHKNNRNKKHKLECSLQYLLKEKKNKKFKKIAITQSSLNRNNFTGNIISHVKAKLIANQITTLINCSPIKILSAGCQCFLETLSHIDLEDEKQYISYYQNAARCQLLIQKTITDIQDIKKSHELVVVICDNNTMDLKVRAENSIWKSFLSAFKIDEQQLMNNYDLVIHLQNIDENNPEANRENQRIQEIWKPYSQYYTFHYDHRKDQNQNVEQAMKLITRLIRPIIPSLSE